MSFLNLSLEVESLIQHSFQNSVFVWVCACQWAGLRWRVAEKSSTSLGRTRMPTHFLWLMHTSLAIILTVSPSTLFQLVPIIVGYAYIYIYIGTSLPFYSFLKSHPVVSIAWPSILTNAEYIDIKNILKPIIIQLLRSAPSYTPGTGSSTEFWVQLPVALTALPRHVRCSCNFSCHFVGDILYLFSSLDR